MTRHQQQIRRLARLSAIEDNRPVDRKSALQVVVDGATVLIDVAGAVDLEKERARLAREAGSLQDELDKIGKRLANPQFLAKAKAETIEEQRERAAEAEAALARTEAALARLGA
jgi:valyl-tRNA synthetase